MQVLKHIVLDKLNEDTIYDDNNYFYLMEKFVFPHDQEIIIIKV